jgi:hypothetical protein
MDRLFFVLLLSVIACNGCVWEDGACSSGGKGCSDEMLACLDDDICVDPCVSYNGYCIENGGSLEDGCSCTPELTCSAQTNQEDCENHDDDGCEEESEEESSSIEENSPVAECNLDTDPCADDPSLCLTLVGIGQIKSYSAFCYWDVSNSTCHFDGNHDCGSCDCAAIPCDEFTTQTTCEEETDDTDCTFYNTVVIYEPCIQGAVTYCAANADDDWCTEVESYLDYASAPRASATLTLVTDSTADSLQENEEFTDAFCDGVVDGLAASVEDSTAQDFTCIVTDVVTGSDGTVDVVFEVSSDEEIAADADTLAQEIETAASSIETSIADAVESCADCDVDVAVEADSLGDVAASDPIEPSSASTLSATMMTLLVVLFVVIRL